MDIKRIENALQVLKYAIENGVSAAVASEACGYTPPYVKNTKRDVINAFARGTITKQQHDLFMNSYSLYEGTKTTGGLENDTNIDLKKKIVGEQLKVEESGNDMTITWSGDGQKFDSEFRATEESDDQEPDEETWGEDGEEEPNYYGHQGYPENHIKTLDGLLNRTGVDLKEWEVADYLVNKWDVTSWSQGFPQTWENFQVKAKLRKNVPVYEGKESAEIFKELIKEYKPPQYIPEVFTNKTNSTFHKENNLLELGLYDLHIGKLGWAGETGENFDVKIAMKRFISILEKILQRANGYTYSKILFPIGNDFFNSDNLNNTTTAGTPQQEDLRWKKTFKMGIQLLISAIDMLKETGVPIDVVVVPGNHDFERSFYLGSVLEAWFNIDDQVVIDNTAPPRKYYEFGEVLLGLTHGKDEKENALPLLMATEAQGAWGRTRFHEWHLGHFHKKRNVKFAVFDKAQIVNEEHSVTVRYLSSLTGTEEWHHRKGYVGTQKAGEAFIWNDESGLIGQINANFVDFDSEH